MLSITSIAKLLGSDILIHPFVKKRLKGVGYNLSVGSYAWSLSTKAPLLETADKRAYIVQAGDTALIVTNETIWVSSKVGGTFHSKVDRVSEGFSSISTTLDPEWIGPLLIAITNLTPNAINLRKDDSFATVAFYRLETPAIHYAKNAPGRTDRLSALGISVSQEASDWFEREEHRSVNALKEVVLASEEYKLLKAQFASAQFLRSYVLPAVPALLVLGSLIYAFTRPGLAPRQQLGPFIGALVAALGILLSQFMSKQR